MSSSSYPTGIANQIAQVVISMLKHLQTFPPDEIYDNIQVMIDELQGSPTTTEEVETQ